MLTVRAAAAAHAQVEPVPGLLARLERFIAKHRRQFCVRFALRGAGLCVAAPVRVSPARKSFTGRLCKFLKAVPQGLACSVQPHPQGTGQQFQRSTNRLD